MADLTNSSISAVNARTMSYVTEFIDQARSSALTVSELDASRLPGFVKKCIGKVRDMYICKDCVILVTTDRQSAFDRQLTAVPCKGQVLNLCSLWWFEQTAHVIPNHVLASPHPNVLIAKRCAVFPVEFVMRGYLTGSTATSLWTHYQQGVRDYCGHTFPDGLVKNQRIAAVLTPTTKSAEHDQLTSAQQIISSGLMSEEDWTQCAAYAEQLFALGQQIALSRGLLLVDSKYEFGRDPQGSICLIDELHTPDSSRYWVADTYDQRMAAGEEPDSMDKEFLRRWYVQQCDPYAEEVLPDAPAELVNELARRYIMLFDVLTGRVFPEVMQSADTMNEDVLRHLDEAMV